MKTCLPRLLFFSLVAVTLLVQTPLPGRRLEVATPNLGNPFFFHAEVADIKIPSLLFITK